MSEEEVPRVLHAAAAGNSQLYRELRFRLKQLAKCCGRQGQTIHLLRSELAELRELHSKLERGDLRRLERVAAEQVETIARLYEKLRPEPQVTVAGLDGVTRVVPMTGTVVVDGPADV